ENTSSSILELASSISDRVQVVSEEKRKVIHLSAVFANNFTNYLYTVAYDLMKESGLSFNDMLPIISESAARLSASDPAEIQAGPAFRNDTKTMEEHEELLRDHPEYKQIYEMMSENIRKLRSNNK
ncbi:MAG: DUF2520 domain-containing protein, partial [Bacteroidetes bacterium]|nr:DUF2520 domain-containing protein [Bacteroidota bacterium]